MLSILRKIVMMVLQHAIKEAARRRKNRRDNGNDATYEQRYQRDSDEASYDHFTSDDKHTHTFKTKRRTTGTFGVEDNDEDTREHQLRHSIERMDHNDDTSHDDYRERKLQQKTEQGSATLRPTIVRNQNNPRRKLFMAIAILAIIAVALALMGFDGGEFVNKILGVLR